MQENVLVTGGAGYLGSLLVPMLLNEGHKVTLLELFNWGVGPILNFATHRNLKIVKGDIRDEKLMKNLVPKHTAVMHLAAIVGYPACSADPNLANTTNLDGSYNVINNARTDTKLIFASTGSTYGKVDGICTEDTPINPLSLYGHTKWVAEKKFLEHKGVGLRFATVFGISPRLRLDLLINDFVYQAIHNKQIVIFEGHFRRTFLHSTDAARSFVFALDNYGKMSGNAYNVGDESMNYTKREVAYKIKEYIDYYIHEADTGFDVDARDYEVSYERIKNLGYKAKVNLDDGIIELKKVLSHIKIVNEWRNA